MARTAAPVMTKVGWGRIINISVSRETMRRGGFSPYGPSKAALESETIIWSQELQGTGVTVNALLPGGATRTGMIPDSVSDQVRSNFWGPDIIVPPLIWLISLLMKSRAGDLSRRNGDLIYLAGKQPKLRPNPPAGSRICASELLRPLFLPRSFL